jgi:hypothetical protein
MIKNVSARMSYSVFYLLTCLFLWVVWKWQLLLHRAFLHYEVCPACNTWYIFAVPYAIKHLEAIKPFNWQATGNFHIFGHSSLLTEDHTRENSLFPTSFQSPYISAAKPLFWAQTNTWIVAAILCRSSFMCIQIKLQSVKNVTWDCSFLGASNVRFS